MNKLQKWLEQFSWSKRCEEHFLKNPPRVDDDQLTPIEPFKVSNLVSLTGNEWETQKEAKKRFCFEPAEWHMWYAVATIAMYVLIIVLIVGLNK